jgi:NADH-quinone oxidoreductase subunit A
MKEDGMKARVAEQNLQIAFCGRVLSPDCLNVLAQRHLGIVFLMLLLCKKLPDASLKLRMPVGYLLLLGFAALATIAPFLALAAGRLMRPSRPNLAKLEAYECGITAVSDARGRYSVRFYIVAMLFVIFDIETIFLFPWAVRYKQLGWFGVAETGIFLAFLVVGYVWILRKGALDWA